MADFQWSSHQEAVFEPESVSLAALRYQMQEDIVKAIGIPQRLLGCPNSHDGRHVYTLDFEYDITGSTVNCEFCGEPEPDRSSTRRLRSHEPGGRGGHQMRHSILGGLSLALAAVACLSVLVLLAGSVLDLEIPHEYIAADSVLALVAIAAAYFATCHQKEG